jgi:opacity protein-like surface antigen
MARMTMIGVLGIGLTFAVAAALDVGVGGFYAPGMAVGPASEVNELKPLGVAGALHLDVNGNLSVSLGGGYTVYKYRERPHIIPAIAGYEFFDEIPIVTLNAGVDYGFPISKFTPYLAGGAVAAFELALYPEKTDVAVAPGIYAGAGVRYFFKENFALEVGPRYTLLFDNPIVERSSLNAEPEYAEEHSQLVDLRVGLYYLF